jgi:two-component system phosphate regulon response regulator PhoB
MARKQILVVEDDEDILELVKYSLSKNGFEVSCVTTGEEALKTVRSKEFNLIVLDLMLPGIDGFEVARALKTNESTIHIPIVMLTAKNEETDIITGLELGADDYITKPFSPKVLVARLRSILRRQTAIQAEGKEIVTLHDITIHPGRHEVQVKGRPIRLTFTEFSILTFLTKRPGWVFSRSQIVDAVHGRDYPVTDRSVDVQVAGLRKKLGSAGKHIETIRGAGYRIRE